MSLRLTAGGFRALGVVSRPIAYAVTVKVSGFPCPDYRALFRDDSTRDTTRTRYASSFRALTTGRCFATTFDMLEQRNANRFRALTTGRCFATAALHHRDQPS